jgi:O-antigen/teichoic acid export membrane protein
VSDPISDLGPATAEPRTSEARQQVRGSSLLLLGRVLAAVIGFATQVLIVRHLSKSDYGVFAYGLSIVVLAQTATTLGLDRAVSRFVPIYEERGERDKALGTIAAVVGAVAALGALVVIAAQLLDHVVAGSFTNDTRAVRVVLVLVLLAPIEAIDNLLIGLFAVFDRPRLIFVRRFLLGPVLRLGVVILLMSVDSDVHFLATGYVVTGAVGVALYSGVLLKVLRSACLLGPGALRSMHVPAKELLFFALPLFTTDLVLVMLEATDAILLGHFGDAGDVAELRAVQSVGRLNQLVLASFGLLFTPLAARLFARQEQAAIRRLYWQTAVWVAVLSFPLFIVSFSLAEPVTLLLFGSRYERSAPILAVLAFGYFFNAALGFNGLTLNVHGLVRSVVAINLAAVVANLILNLVLIPWLGPIGAAIGTAATLVAQNVLRQVVLARRTGIPAFDRGMIDVYVLMAGGAGAVAVVQLLFAPPLAIGLLLAALVSAAVLARARHSMELADAFPELARLPLLRYLTRARR